MDRPGKGRPARAPVPSELGRIEVGFVDKPDPRLNALGVKGLGEAAMVGVAPAIVNAVVHATGRRLRKLPVRLDDLVRNASSRDEG